MNPTQRSLKNRLSEWLKLSKNRTFIIALVAMIVLIGITEWMSNSTHPTENIPESADTYIPDGFVLVPIELQNLDSIASLVGDVAVVDLFQGPLQKRVGKRLKLLRAPLNPQQYAVLIAEADAPQLMRSPGPYWAVIQNPNMPAKKSLEGKKIKNHRIEYFTEN